MGAEVLSFQVDPNTKTGRSYNFDLSIQRRLPGNMVIEGAFLSRESRDLPQAVNVNSAPYMFKDTASGQTFAQAYDLVANALRSGQTAPTEPFFENQFPGLAAQKAPRPLRRTLSERTKPTSPEEVWVLCSPTWTIIAVGWASRPTTAIRQAWSLSALMSDMRTTTPAIVTLSKRMSHGFSFSANYTFAKAIDDGLSNQNNAGFYSNSFNPGVQYGPSSYDRRSVLNAYYQYDVPAGKGHRLHTGNFVDHIIGGWYTSGIVAAWTGLPLKVSEGSQVWGGGNSSIGATDYMVPINPPPSTGVNHNVSNTTTCSNSVFSGTVAANVGGASGTNLDIFSNPGAAYCDFGYIQLSTTGRTGSGGPASRAVVLEYRHARRQRHPARGGKNAPGILGRFLQRLQPREFRQPGHQLYESRNIRGDHSDLHSAEPHQRWAVDRTGLASGLLADQAGTNRLGRTVVFCRFVRKSSIRRMAFRWVCGRTTAQKASLRSTLLGAECDDRESAARTRGSKVTPVRLGRHSRPSVPVQSAATGQSRHGRRCNRARGGGGNRLLFGIVGSFPKAVSGHSRVAGGAAGSNYALYESPTIWTGFCHFKTTCASGQATICRRSNRPIDNATGPSAVISLGPPAS